MPDVFISYSRRNLEFVQQLVDALKQRGKDPWFDQLKEPLSGIAAGAPWWEQIKHGIETVDNFLFVITPNSISSPYCHAEISYAREHGKRLVPLLYCGWIGEGETRQAIDAAIEAIPDDEEIPDSVTSSILNLKQLVRANWLAISDIQHVVFASSVPYEQSLEQVIQALDLDLAWVKMHSQLTQAAKLWEANNFHDDFLWGANRLRPVHDMINRRKPELDTLVREFLEPKQERLIRELKDLQTTHQRRLQIGVHLASIGDIRPGLGVKVVNFGEQTLTMPDVDWCPVVTAGEITIERHEFAVKPLSAARYLTTHRQFQAFVDAPDGFAGSQCWRGMPKQYQKHNMANARNQLLNAPCDSVSWYQAVAFCRWLDALYTQLGWKTDPKLQVRLPTEWEWQWIAQNGEETRQYPWGAWDNQPRANTDEAGISQQSTAVGMYPDGAAACGALDMAGNLLEWCLNDYEDISRIRLSKGRRKVLRGGSFSSIRTLAAASYRHASAPGSRSNNFGFRVVMAFPIDVF